jgi:alpha-tubulin suppressor-like RCC1 family protein
MKGFRWFPSFVRRIPEQDDLVVQIAGGWRHTMAVTEDGKLYGWGWNKVIDHVDSSEKNILSGLFYLLQCTSII